MCLACFALQRGVAPLCATLPASLLQQLNGGLHLSFSPPYKALNTERSACPDHRTQRVGWVEVAAATETHRFRVPARSMVGFTLVQPTLQSAQHRALSVP